MKLAIMAGFQLWPTQRGGLRITSGFVLEFGPHVSPDEIATAACRRMLAREGVFEEAEVVELVHGYGFNFAGLGFRVPRIAS